MTFSNYIPIFLAMRKEYLDELPAHWQNMAEILHALGDATRQRILLLFEPEEELMIKTIVDLFPFSRTAIAHHIAVLEKAGLLFRRKAGRDVFLRLNKVLLVDTLRNILIYVETEV